MSEMRLSELGLKEWGEISGLEDCEISARLTDMGMYPGKKVQISFMAPFGDPIAIDLEGYTLSLRKSEAQKVIILPLN